MAAAAAAAVRVASVLREMSGDAEEVEPDDDSEEIMQGVIRRLNAEAASLAPRKPCSMLSTFLQRDPEEVRSGADTVVQARIDKIREWAAQRTEGITATALPDLDEYVSTKAWNLTYSGMGYGCFSMIERQMWGILRHRDAPGFQDTVKYFLSVGVIECVMFAVVDLAKRSRNRVVKWMMHFFDAIPKSQQHSFFAYVGCIDMEAYPKTSVRIARCINLEDFVLCPVHRNGFPAPTLDDVKFVHGILGQSFRPEIHYFEYVIKWDASTILAYLLAIPDVFRSHDSFEEHDFLMDLAMEHGAMECSKCLAENLNWESEDPVERAHMMDRVLGAAKNGHVECLRYAIEHGARCDARELLQNPDVQNMEVIQYLRTLALVANDGASDTEETEDALRNTLATVTTAAERGHLREETYIQAANDLMRANQQRRQQRNDD